MLSLGQTQPVHLSYVMIAGKSSTHNTVSTENKLRIYV